MLIQILIQILDVDTNDVQKLIQIVDTDILEARGKLFAHGPGLVKDLADQIGAGDPDTKLLLPGVGPVKTNLCEWFENKYTLYF